ncbi:MAG: adenine phosphoribosyltransferase [bacterium]|nr:adenine phosphoribosyltransferase [bacterium]
MDFKQYIKDIQDWPEKGVVFRDMTPLLQDKDAFKKCIDDLAAPFEKEGIETVVGIDARGFILAAGVAYKLGAGLAIIRKKGKLPRKTVKRDYGLEYGSNTIEMHEDAIKKGSRVLIVDDVLATGGTMAATCEMVEELKGSIVGIAFLAVLDYLPGAEKLKKYKVHTLARY